MSEHVVILGYFNHDDGVWVLCSCGFEQNLGFAGTPEEAWAVEQRHRRETA